MAKLRPDTPTPWDFVQGGPTRLAHVETRHDNPNGAGLPVCSIPKKRTGDAAFIVLACNAHHDLLDALKKARECIAYCRRAHSDAQSGTGIPVEALIDAAIAKAEGR